VKQPAVEAQDFQQALDQSKTMMSAPVILTGKAQSWTLTAQEIVSYMDFSSQIQNGVSTLVPYLSADKMKAFFDSIAGQVATKPKDATFANDGQKAWVVPGVPGEALDAEATTKALTEAALQTTGRTAQVAVTAAEPAFTTEEAQAYGITDLLASYTTPSYVGSANRQVNVRITTQYASNKFLAPGQEYDFDKTIGPRIAARGYKTAPGIVGNGELDEVLGGGICQVSTTLFNAVFEAGLKVTERHNHSLYISHYPAGRDATVAGGGGKNFRFVNDTAHYIWIVGKSTGVTTTFYIYGTKDGRSVQAHFSGFSYGAARTQVTELDPTLKPGTTHVKIDGQSGRSCSETRVVTYADGTTHKDVFVSDYPMIPKTIDVGPTTTTTTTTPRQTTTTTQPGTGTTVVTQF
jgi:vancomycin resistance protein YoaR